ncbi:transcriptional regulator [Reichenbachiella sp. MALMAid0571]|uniref:helix-turn-helix domain-containing protein n=1 Tax=Reichenbachiella sp. MALMAid0571 TaxID=3143939 RepID=UPI0032DE9E14
MEIKVLKSEKEYDCALDRVDQIFEAKPNTADGDELELLLILIKDYEDKHHQISLPDPLVAIKLKMDELGLRAKDFVPTLGSKGYVSQILNGKKPLTAPIMRLLHQKLGIPAEILLS